MRTLNDYLGESVMDAPTKKELLAYLDSIWKIKANEYEFEAEEAIYWFAKSSRNLLWASDIIRMSDYKPSILIKSINDTDSEVSIDMYNDLHSKYGKILGEARYSDSDETGLIVKFRKVDKNKFEKYLDKSEYYGYEIENNQYLFPSPEDEFDSLEMALTKDFDKHGFDTYSFEGA